MKYLVIMPTMVASIAKPCIRSMSPSVRANTLFIDNSEKGFMKPYKVRSIHHPENYGVARSWNMGAKEVVDQKLDYLIILSAAVVFRQGMDDFIRHLERTLDEGYYGVETQFSYHLVAIARKTFEEIGYFDENFYPAYYEETDFMRRMELAGIKEIMDNPPSFPLHSVDAKRQGFALSIKKGGLHVDFLKLVDYFEKKWGLVPEYDDMKQRAKMHKHPFNNPKHGLDYFPKSTVPELVKRYELEVVA